jgi:hypothetical protein
MVKGCAEELSLMGVEYIDILGNVEDFDDGEG